MPRIAMCPVPDHATEKEIEFAALQATESLNIFDIEGLFADDGPFELQHWMEAVEHEGVDCPTFYDEFLDVDEIIRLKAGRRVVREALIEYALKIYLPAPGHDHHITRTECLKCNASGRVAVDVWNRQQQSEPYAEHHMITMLKHFGMASKVKSELETLGQSFVEVSDEATVTRLKEENALLKQKLSQSEAKLRIARNNAVQIWNEYGLDQFPGAMRKLVKFLGEL